jgi:hypothetical protein
VLPDKSAGLQVHLNQKARWTIRISLTVTWDARGGCYSAPYSISMRRRRRLESANTATDKVRRPRTPVTAEAGLTITAIVEQSPESAAAALSKLRQRFGEAAPAQVADEAFQADDQYLSGICMFRKGRYIGGFANMPGPKDATTQAVSLAEHLPGM